MRALFNLMQTDKKSFALLHLFLVTGHIGLRYLSYQAIPTDPKPILTQTMHFLPKCRAFIHHQGSLGALQFHLRKHSFGFA